MKAFGKLPVAVSNNLHVLFPPIGDSDYRFYKFYQVNRNQSVGEYTDLPLVVVDHLEPGVIQEAPGNDIRVFDSAGLPIDYESFIIVNPNTSADIVVWVKMPLAKDLEFIQMTFGRSPDSNGENKTGLWSDYKYVMHLNNDINFGSLSIFDSSPDPHSLEPFGGLQQVDGLLGKAINFDGLNSSRISGNPLLFGNKLMMNGSDIAISVVIKPTLTGTQFQRIIDKSNGGTGANGYTVALDIVDKQIEFYIDGGISMRSNNVITDPNKFYHILVCKKNGVDEGHIYINGIDETESIPNPSNTIPDVETNIIIGNWNTLPFDRTFSGILEHLTISDIIPSVDEIITQTNNILDNDAFWHKTPLLEK